METQKYNIDTNFKLRPFEDRDYAGFVEMKNIVYPDNPWSVETLRHRDNTREKKLNIGAGSGKKTKILWCPLCIPSTRNLIIPIDL